MEVHGEEKVSTQSPSEVNTPGAQNITICWSTLSIALATTSRRTLNECVSGSLPSHHPPTSKAQRIPILVQARKARWYREDPGVRETKVSAPYSPACVLLFCRPKI